MGWSVEPVTVRRGSFPSVRFVRHLSTEHHALTHTLSVLTETVRAAGRGPLLTLCVLFQHHNGPAVREGEGRGRLSIRGLQRGEHLWFLKESAVTPTLK